MKKLFILILITPLSCLMFGQTDSALYVKFRFHITKNFELKDDSISKKLASEIFFLLVYSKDKSLDSFTIWQSGNNINYKKLEKCVTKTMDELKRIRLEKSIILPIIIYNIDNKTWKDKKSRELQEYLKKESELTDLIIPQKNFTVFKSIIITQMTRSDNKKVY